MEQTLKPFYQMVVEIARPVTVNDICKIYNKSKYLVQNSLKELYDEGYLTRRGIGSMYPYFYEANIDADKK